MSQRPGQVEVITEVGYCPSCGRSRTLRSEAHHLGQLVRTIVTCETCHRTLSSSIGVAPPEPVKAEPEREPEPTGAPAPAPAKAVAPATKAAAPVKKLAPAKKAAPAKKSIAKKPAAAKKPASARKAAPKKAAARGGKPTSTATRKTTRRK